MEMTGYGNLENLSTDVYETQTVTGRRRQKLLARFDHNQSIGKPVFYHFKIINATDEKSTTSTREKNIQLLAAVLVSKTSMLKFSNVSPAALASLMRERELVFVAHSRSPP